MLHRFDVIAHVMSSDWFPPDMTLGIEAKQFNLLNGLLQRILPVWSVFAKSKAGLH